MKLKNASLDQSAFYTTVMKAIAVGILSTLVMDTCATILHHFNVVGNISANTLGRIAVGWLKGRFIYHSPTELQAFQGEHLFGIVSHYTIGAILCLFMVFMMHFFKLQGRNSTLVFPIIYGILTTMFAWFWLAPSIGFGIAGLSAPAQVMFVRTSLINHLNYGIGLSLFYNLLFQTANFGLLPVYRKKAGLMSINL